MPRLHGGGWAAIAYTLRMADRVGWRALWKAMRSRNACKTCALGMGGQRGGMVNEAGHFPEVCKKSLQAMAADMQDGVAPEFFRRYSLDQLRTLSPRELESAGRLVQPIVAGPGDSHYRVLGWDEALSRLAAKLRDTSPEQAFVYVSGRSSNEAGFLIQLFARLYGTNHVNNCSYYCHQASGVGLSKAIGTGTATVTLDDLEHADLFVLIGGNPASNHPRLMRSLMLMRRRGAKVVVINPAREPGLEHFRVPSDWRSLIFGTDIASDYFQPHIGGDIALMTGVAKFLIERDAVDHSFIDSATAGWADFRASVESAAWSDVERVSGVARSQIERLADLYAASRRAVFGWTMGITHHEHGVENVRMIANLALMRGMIGRDGAGLLPIRGHSNVQGMGSVGVTPQLRDAIFERLQEKCGVALPTFRGHDTMSCMEAAARGEMRVGLCLGGNLFGANPDAGFAARSLGGVELVAYMNTTLNTGHVQGRGRDTLVLPVLARDEEPQATTQESMFSFVRMSDGGEARHAGPLAETAVIARLGQLVLGDSQGAVDWRELESHAAIRRWIAETVPGYEQVSTMDRTRQEFFVAGRRLEGRRFAMPGGRAVFWPAQIRGLRTPADADARRGAIELRLMTIRSEGQFNTVVYEEEDLYRGQDRRDIILMNPSDMERAGLAPDAPVTVRSSVGEMHGIVVRPFDVRAGNAMMYYPEANALVPRGVDPQSRTPAYKNIAITVERQGVARSESDGRISLHVAGHGRSRELNAC